MANQRISNDNAPRLLATHLCEDALAGLAGRLTLYNLFGEQYAASWPALVPRLVVANTWLRETGRQGDRETGGQGDTFTERVVILNPDHQGTVAEAASSWQFDAPLHTTVSRFLDVVLPRPGTYRVLVLLGQETIVDYPLLATDTSESGKEANP